MEEAWEWRGGGEKGREEERKGQLETSWGAQMEQVRTWRTAEWRWWGSVWRGGHEKAGRKRVAALMQGPEQGAR